MILGVTNDSGKRQKYLKIQTRLPHIGQDKMTWMKHKLKRRRHWKKWCTHVRQGWFRRVGR